MYNLIQKFCNNSIHSTGLMFLDTPTGLGKTYSTIQYIHDTIKNNPNQKIFFITKLKKNLPIDSLKILFQNNNDMTTFNNSVLYVRSNYESFYFNYIYYKNKNIKLLEESNTILYNKFKKMGELVDEIEQNININTADQYSNEKILEELEKDFRKNIEFQLKNHFPTKEQRLDAIHNDKNWQWVGKLYPVVFTSEKQVKFMSVDKFLYPYSTIVEPSYEFINSDEIKNAIIFIDEVDTAKDVILNKIISSAHNITDDVLGLFLEIFNNSFNDSNKQFYSYLTKNDNEAKNNFNLKLLENLKIESTNIYNKYELNKNYKFGNSKNINIDEYFLFKDYLDIRISEKYICKTFNKEKNVHSLEICDDPDPESLVVNMLGEIKYFFKNLQFATHKFAENYQYNKANEYDIYGEKIHYLYDDAIMSVLSELGVRDENIKNKIKYNIIRNQKKYKKNMNKLNIGFYEEGFEFFLLKNHIQHDTKSIINLYSYKETPEKFLLDLANTSKVVGISATANMDTIISNFGIDYLKNNLGDRFYEIPQEDINRIKKQFDSINKGYENVNINIDFLNDDYNQDSSINPFENIFKTKELAQQIHKSIKNTTDSEYYYKHYLRIALVYKSFVEKKDINSCLCLLNRIPKNESSECKQSILDDIFNFINEDYKDYIDYIEENININNYINNIKILYLNSNDFDNTKDYMLERLYNQEKLFVISTYQTLGAGQNIHYKIKSDENLVKINNKYNKLEKDFDAIYLENPTNILNMILSQDVNKDISYTKKFNKDDYHELTQEYIIFIEKIFQIKYLEYIGEISLKQSYNQVKQIFNTYYYKNYNENKLENLNNLKSIKNAKNKIIIQALGRICRTNLKNPNIYIFANKELKNVVDKNLKNNLHNKNNLFFLSPEFIALANECNITNDLDNLDENYKKLKNTAYRTSLMANNYINKILNFQNFNFEKIKIWKELREFVLKYPTFLDADFKNLRQYEYYKLYVKLPEQSNVLYYKQKNNFNQIEVDFNKTLDTNTEVSDISCNLSGLMKIPEINNLFETNNYAQTFKNGDYILSPPLFNNIYKGAIGEKIGEMFFEKYLNIILQEIDDPKIFEFFDFKVPDTNIFIDFKYWNKNSSIYINNTNEIYEKIYSKLEQCNGKIAIIVNIILYDKDQYRIKENINKDMMIIEIPYLYVQNNNNKDDYKVMDLENIYLIKNIIELNKIK